MAICRRAAPRKHKVWATDHADEQFYNQPAHNHNGKWPLRVGADVVRHGCRQQAKSGHQHGHHDGSQPQSSAFASRFAHRESAHAKLIDVLNHDDTDFDRDADQRQKA